MPKSTDAASLSVNWVSARRVALISRLSVSKLMRCWSSQRERRYEYGPGRGYRQIALLQRTQQSVDHTPQRETYRPTLQHDITQTLDKL